MRALLLVLLVLVLGGGALFLLLDSEDGRGVKVPRRPTTLRGPKAEPTVPADIGRVASPEVKRPPRQRLEGLDAPAARWILEGAVIADGEPLPSAELALWREGAVLGEARTDEAGHFRLESVPLTAAGTLRVQARGFVALERPLAPKPIGGTTLLGNLRLLRGQRIVGRVLDGNGRGVSDAELRAEPTHPGSDVPFALARSAADGSFELADAPPGTVAVTARAAGFADQIVRYTASPQPFEIRLAPGAVLRLRLHAARGKSVVGAEVMIQAKSEVQGVKRVQKTDEDGRVVFEGLGSPVWSARVVHPDYMPSGQQVQANGIEQLIECQPWPAIEGVVRAPGGQPPPAGTRVVALPAATPGDGILPLEGGTEVGADGYFRVGGLRAGDWRIRVAAPGFAPASSGPVKLGIEGDGFAGTIELAPGGGLAFALALAGGVPAAAELELFRSEPTPAQLWSLASSRTPELGRRVQSGADGRALFENLPPGRVWVAVYAEGCPPTRSGPHEVGAAGAAPPAIPIELTRGAQVHGRVLSRTGVPQPDSQVRIIEDARRVGSPLLVASDAEGRYTSAWLPPGRYTLEAFASEDPTRRSGPSELELAAGEQRVLDLSL